MDDIAEKYIEGRPQVSEVPVLPDEGSVIQGLDTEDKSLREGTITYDIRFRAIVPGTGERIALIINVEAQNDFYPGYPLIIRGIYYCCRSISSQYGREFTGSHYEKIKKVYSIWICTDPPKSRQNTINRYRLTEEHLVGEAQEPVEHYDLLSVIMLCLGGPDGANYDGILRMLDVLLSDGTGAAEKRRILREDYDIEMTRDMEQEVAHMCNLGEGLVARTEAKTRAKTRAKARAEGRAEGVAENRLFSIRSLMETVGMTLEQAMSALRVPEDERQKYVELLARQ